MVERSEICTYPSVGNSQQGRPLVGQQSQHTLAIEEIERTRHIRPLSSFHGETPKGRHTVQSQHDGYEDRLERRADLIGDAQLVIPW